MKKFLRISVSIILGCLLLGMLFYMVGVSHQVVAAGDIDPKLWMGKVWEKRMNDLRSTLLVNTLEDELNSDGDCSLREAIEAANTNASVDMCGSGDVLTDTITFSVDGTIILNNELLVNAGGPLLIDGGDAITLSGGGTTHVLSVQSSELILQSLAISDGLFGNGGGLYKLSGNLAIINCQFLNNITNLGVGGAIYNKEGSLSISDSVFSGNFAQYPGGGIYNLGSMTISNTIFSENASGGEAGAIDNVGSMTIINSIFSANISAGGGGAIRNGGSISIHESFFSGNHSDTNGGAISNEGSIVIINSTISENSSNGAGGAIDNWIYSDGEMIVNNSTISGNTAASAAGGINSKGNATIMNSAIFGNNSPYGGGIYNKDTIEVTTLSIINSTISTNTASLKGGGIYNLGLLFLTNNTISDNNSPIGGGVFGKYGNVDFVNTIVANSLSGGDCTADGGTISDSGHNLDSDGTCGLNPAKGSLPNTDPMLESLQDKGGPTLTHALLDGSPAIDAGDNTHCPATDQRGMHRPLDGNGDGLFVCDIGAFEAGVYIVHEIFLPLVIRF
jgi:CSLREA domain-containing protein